jgi:YD repeat-containing protein
LHISSTDTKGSKSTTSYTYDPQGRILKTTWSQPSGPAKETYYIYDGKGRLIGITGNGEQSSIFQYDDQGRKTRIVRSESSGRIAGATDDGSDNFFMPPPVGGHMKTWFDERNQATESQVYDAYGQLTGRLVRRFDAKGRLVESSVIENLESLLPLEARPEPGVLGELKKKLMQFRSLQWPSGSSFTYDEEGRVIETHFRTGPYPEVITKMTYNGHGDLYGHTTTVGDLDSTNSAEGSEISSTAAASPSSHETEVRFSYQYDSFGNWTERTISARSSMNGPFEISAVHHRRIAYYAYAGVEAGSEGAGQRPVADMSIRAVTAAHR